MRLLKPFAGMVVLAIVATSTPHAQDRTTDQVSPPPAPRLAPTAHPPLPANPSQYWLVPDLAAPRPTTTLTTATAVANFVKAVNLIGDREYAAALPLIDGGAIASTPLGAYGYYYSGVALSALQRFVDADAAFAAAD